MRFRFSLVAKLMRVTVIALFGAATGKTGRRVLDRALAGGDEVRALVRDPGKLAARPGLSVIVGDVLDADAVDRTIAGCGVVWC